MMKYVFHGPSSFYARPAHNATRACPRTPSPGPIFDLTSLIAHFPPHKISMSNILNVLNPPPSRPLSDEECLPCTAVQLAVCLGGGGYFLLLLPFKGKNGVVDLKKHPVWFQRGVRGVGIGLVALGMYRLGEVVQIYGKKHWL